MLLNNKGERVVVGKLSKDDRADVLAPLRELLVPTHVKGDALFRLDQRARNK